MRKSLRSALPVGTPWMAVDDRASTQVKTLLHFDVDAAQLRVAALGVLLKGGDIDPSFRSKVPYEEIRRVSEAIRMRIPTSARAAFSRVASAVDDESRRLLRLLTHYGPEQLAAIDWAGHMDDVSTALAKLLPRAELRYKESTVFSSWADYAPPYEAIRDNTRAICEACKTLSHLVSEAKRHLENYRGRSLPGLEAKNGRSSLESLALTEGRLHHAGLTYGEIAILIPEECLDVCRSNGSIDGQKTLRRHKGRIRKRVESVADRLREVDEARARGRELARQISRQKRAK